LEYEWTVKEQRSVNGRVRVAPQPDLAVIRLLKNGRR
jgi:hypothetical protein